MATGLLGCPACHARYPIADGVVDFAGGTPGPRPPDESLPSEPVRLAAQLGLAEPGGVVLLTGRYAFLADGLRELVEVTCLVADVVGEILHSQPSRSGCSTSCRCVTPRCVAAAIDAPRTTSGFLAEVTRCVAGRGRVVARARSRVAGRRQARCARRARVGRRGRDRAPGDSAASRSSLTAIGGR